MTLTEGKTRMANKVYPSTKPYKNPPAPRLGSELGKDITPFVVLSSPYAYKHNVYLQNYLESPEEMIAVLDVLNTASEDDQIIIHLNSGGGDTYSLDTLLYAMANCPAHKHVIASGQICSAATFILLAADTFEVSPFTVLLFHTCTFGAYGQSQDNLEFVQFIHQANERLMREYYKHLFSEEEIDDIIINKRQRWLTAEEFCTRYDKAKSKHIEDMKEADSKQEAEMEAAFNEQFPVPSEECLKKLKPTQLRKLILDQAYLDENETYIEYPVK